MDSAQLDPEMLRSFRGACATALKDFAASSSSFKVVRTVPKLSAEPPSTAKTLYVLDASFNPPNKAHNRMVMSAVCDDISVEPKRVLLLLATQNADKATKPASLEDRLVMMTLLAHELRYGIQRHAVAPEVDVCLVKQPYFHDKAAVVNESGVYKEDPQQVYLVGYDTLIRIFDTKYYPPNHDLGVLGPFMGKHRFRATLRTDDQWGNRQDQENYIQAMAKGERRQEGAQPQWASKISLIQVRQDGEGTISSTLARQAAKHNPSHLDQYVDPTIRDWIVSEQLYRDGD